MNKVRAMAAAATMVLLATAPAFAADVIGNGKNFGVGGGGGRMTSGLTAKYYLSPTTAVQGVVGLGGWGTSVSADFIKEFPTLAEGSAGRLFWGAGVGAGAVMYNVGSNSATILGVSGVIQLGWHFASFPLELVSDWRPTFFIGDYIGGLWWGGGGGALRWFF